jgi:hypothetical protein
MTIQPGFSGSSASAAKRAAANQRNAADARESLPVDPTSTGRAVERNDDAKVREIDVGGVPRTRRRSPDDDELSATTSVSENLNAW